MTEDMGHCFVASTNVNGHVDSHVDVHIYNTHIHTHHHHYHHHLTNYKIFQKIDLKTFKTVFFHDLLKLFIMYLGVLATCLCTTFMQFSRMPEESSGSSGVGVAVVSGLI